MAVRCRTATIGKGCKDMVGRGYIAVGEDSLSVYAGHHIVLRKAVHGAVLSCNTIEYVTEIQLTAHI